METKLFLIEEHLGTLVDSTEIEQWSQLVNDLGLQGQKELIKPEKSPIPFPVLNEMENDIYSSILNQKQDYKSYDSEAIPLKVLSMIALCEKEKYFKRIEIWYSEKNPDPLVIGKRFRDAVDEEKQYTWRMVSHKIAQWGAKLLPAIALLPAYDEYMRDQAKDSYDYAIKQHEEKMRRFKLIGKAFEEAL